jgi:hypothetical protein
LRNLLFKRHDTDVAPVTIGSEARMQPQPYHVEKLHPSGHTPVHAETHYSGLPRQEVDSVISDIAAHNSKSAVEKAKAIHKRFNTTASENLLVEAYMARIQSMLQKGMAAEAKELTELVGQRYSSARARIAQIRLITAVRSGDIAKLVAELDNPAVSPERKGEIENLLRCNLTDFSILADCSSLSATHPLRLGAAALIHAFEAVTGGSVEDSAIELPEISRRSPLAPWKLLVRAIAYFYRHDDLLCVKTLDSIESDSAAAGGAALLRSMLNNDHTGSPDAPATRLFTMVIGRSAELKAPLAKLDELFGQNSHNNHKKILTAVRDAISICSRTRPKLLLRLRQHISIRCFIADMEAHKVVSAMGGHAVHDAYFFRLFARGAEMTGQHLQACGLWEHFRRHALNEELFQKDGQEEASLYLHMAELLRRIPDDILRKAQDRPRLYADLDYLYEDQPEHVQVAVVGQIEEPDAYYFHPDTLYARAIRYAPTSAIYKDWLDYACKSECCRISPDEVAEKWSQAFPDDSRPLLHLMESAEERNAFDKAIKFIEQAERLDALNPDVKKARWRLGTAKLFRHLKQQKPKLAEKDIAEITSLAAASEGDRPAFIIAVRRLCALLQNDPNTAEQLREQLCTLAGSRHTSDLILKAVARHCSYSDGIFAETLATLTKDTNSSMAASVARVWMLCADIGMHIALSGDWKTTLPKEVAQKNCCLNTAELLAIGELATVAKQYELAFAVSAKGLASGEQQAKFMLLRAESLPTSEFDRRQDCFAAALELARRQRNMELAASIIDTIRRYGGFYAMNADEMRLTDDELAQILKHEQEYDKYGKNAWLGRYKGIVKKRAIAPCDCPACRRQRGELPENKNKKQDAESEKYLFEDMFDEDDDTLDAFEEDESEEDEFDDDYDDLDDSDDMMPPAGMPLEAIEVMAELFKFTGGRPPKKGDVDRLKRERPDLAEKLMRMLSEMERPFDDPVQSRVERERRRRKRKQQRRNRRR